MKKSVKKDEVLRFIKEFMKEHGYTPTIREIGEGIGLASASSVHLWFNRLALDGEIIRQGDGKRYTVKGMRYIEDKGV